VPLRDSTALAVVEELVEARGGRAIGVALSGLECLARHPPFPGAILIFVAEYSL
jgi:hypothetical protein